MGVSDGADWRFPNMEKSLCWREAQDLLAGGANPADPRSWCPTLRAIGREDLARQMEADDINPDHLAYVKWKSAASLEVWW